jgi:hypothetical protein
MTSHPGSSGPAKAQLACLKMVNPEISQRCLGRKQAKENTIHEITLKDSNNFSCWFV